MRLLAAAAVLLCAACQPAPAPAQAVRVSPPPTVYVPQPKGQTDTDCDGIPDTADRCPREPEDVDGFEDSDGCPDLDNDRDGIPDACDACPGEPETKNGYLDEDGCPDRPLVRIMQDNLRITTFVRFPHGSAQPSAQSAPVVRAVADVLLSHPEFELLALVGHAEPGEPNPAVLSQSRAAAVRDRLLAAGIEKTRIEVHGAGSDHPVTSGVPNRVVSFHVLRTAGVEVGRWKGTEVVQVGNPPPIQPQNPQPGPGCKPEPVRPPPRPCVVRGP